MRNSLVWNLLHPRLKQVNSSPTSRPCSNFLSLFHSCFSLRNAEANCPSRRLAVRDARGLGHGASRTFRPRERHAAPGTSVSSAPGRRARGQGRGAGRALRSRTRRGRDGLGRAGASFRARGALRLPAAGEPLRTAVTLVTRATEEQDALPGAV